ncbi:methyltransferase small [Candidatus Magnetomorum sp. HK-1]|nr:methyltransferase small [Candidatus Magnetomorum sp. HK-1]
MKKLTIQQAKNVHRFSLDSVLLADNVFPKKNNRILDIGCGCGVISIILAHKNPDVQITGIDIYEPHILLAKQNVLKNNIEGQVDLLCKDIRTIKGNTFDKFHKVVCNPPFRKKNSGRNNNSKVTAIAREEIFCTIDDIMRASRKVLVNMGELIVIYPSERVGEVLIKMNEFNLEAKEMIPIYSKAHLPAKWFIIKGRLNSKPGVIVHPPIFTDQLTHLNVQGNSI